MAEEQIGGVAPAPVTGPEGVPPEGGTAPVEPVTPQEPATAPELPANWDDDPRFRGLKGWVQAQTSKAVKEAVGARDAQWTEWANKLEDQLESYQTEKLAPEQLAEYYRKKEEGNRQQFQAWAQQEQFRLTLAQKYGVPIDRLAGVQGVEAMADAAVGYMGERLAEIEKKVEAINKPASQRQLVKPSAPATAPVEPPKVAGGGTTTAPKGATAEFFSMTPEERKKILRNPQLARELWERAGQER